MSDWLPDALALVGILTLSGGIWSLFGWGWALVVGGSLIYLTTVLVMWKANAAEPPSTTEG